MRTDTHGGKPAKARKAMFLSMLVGKGAPSSSAMSVWYLVWSHSMATEVCMSHSVVLSGEHEEEAVVYILPL